MTDWNTQALRQHECEQSKAKDRMRRNELYTLAANLKTAYFCGQQIEVAGGLFEGEVLARAATVINQHDPRLLPALRFLATKDFGAQGWSDDMEAAAQVIREYLQRTKND